MQDIRFFVIVGIQLITVLVGIFNYKYFNDRYLRYFFYFICYGLIGELVALIFDKMGVLLNVFFLIYNTYSVVFTIFLGLFFRNYMNRNSFRNLTSALLGVFIFGVVVNSFVSQSFISTLQNNTYILGFFTVALVIVFYFIDILNSNNIMHLQKLPHFWIGMGAFIFSLCFLPVLVIARFIGWTGVYDYILLGINIFMYVMYIKAFYVSKENYKKVN